MADDFDAIELILDIPEGSFEQDVQFDLGNDVEDASLELDLGLPEAPAEEEATIPVVSPSRQPDEAPLGDFSQMEPTRPRVLAPEGVEAPVPEGSEEASSLQIVKDAASAEWSVAAIARSMGTQTFDPNFKMSTELFDELTEGLPEEYQEEFSDTLSEEHARAISKRLHSQFEVAKRLQEAGGWGVGARVAAAFLDPGAIALTAVTGGLAAPFLAASKVGRAGRALRVGALAAGENVAIDGLIVANTPTAQNSDLIYSAVGGLALGSLIGSVTRGGPKEDLQDLHDAAVRVQKEIETAEADLSGSVGAAQAQPIGESRLNPRQQEAVDDAWEAPRTYAGRLRVDSVGQLKSSENGLARQTGDVLGEDAVGNADGSASGRGGTATEAQELEHRVAQASFSRAVERTFFANYAKEHGLTGIGRRRAKKAFMDEVSRAVRAGDHPDPHVKAAASHVADLQEGILSRLKEAGVAGFDNVDANRNYVMRLYSPQKLSKMIETYTEGGVRQVIASAISRGLPELEQETVEKIAHWHLRKVRDHGDDIDFQMGRALSGDDRETLRAVLVEEGVLDNVEVDRLFDLLKKPQEGHSRSRQRLYMDETAEIGLMNRLTGQIDEGVRLDHMFENDAETLFNLYSRQTSGAIAMARAGFPSVSAFERHVQDVRAAAMDMVGQTDAKGRLIDADRAKKIADKDQDNLEFLGSMVFGRPLGIKASAHAQFKRSQTGQYLKRLRDYNFVRVMNQVGIAQIPEIGNILGTMGVKAFLSAIPAFRDIVRASRGGRLVDQVSDEIETIWGSGTDVLRGRVEWRWDDYGSGFDATAEATRGNRADTVLDEGKRITNQISGMAVINTTLQKWVAKSAVQRFTDMAHGKTRKWSAKRFASYGLDADDVEAIFEGIRQNISTRKAVFSSNKVTRIGDLSEWADGDAAERFRMAVFRISRQAIQENDPGNMSRLMGNPLAQTIMQFRTFLMVSIYKQLLRGVAVRDINTWASFTASSMAAALAYTGHTHVKSLGRDDRDAFLEERLSARAIGGAAVGRSAWGAIIPALVDTSMGALQQDPLFSHYRSTGLSSSFWGNPSVSLVEDNIIGGIGGTVGNLATSGQVSRENMRNVLGIAPFQNAFGIANIQRMIYQDLPRQVD